MQSSEPDPYYDSVRGKPERLSEYATLNIPLQALPRRRRQRRGGRMRLAWIVAALLAAALLAFRYFAR